MNREKGLFRLAIVLSPVFGIGLYLIDRLLFPYVYDFYGEKTTKDYGSFANWLGELELYDGRPGGFDIAILTIIIGGSIPFLVYLGYKFVLGGFYPEEDRFQSFFKRLTLTGHLADPPEKTDDLDE